MQVQRDLKAWDGFPDDCYHLLISHCRDARIVFKAGKNRDGYFDADDLLSQVDNAIDIFEERTCGFATALFLFDNAPSHQKCASDAFLLAKCPRTQNKDGHTTKMDHT